MTISVSCEKTSANYFNGSFSDLFCVIPKHVRFVLVYTSGLSGHVMIMLYRTDGDLMYGFSKKGRQILRKGVDLSRKYWLHFVGLGRYDSRFDFRW